MQLRFPWVLSRKRLIAAVVADATLFAFLYYGLYEWRFGVWPGISPRLAALLSVWSLISYVVGRYVSGADNNRSRNTWSIFGKQLIGTVFVLLLTLGLTLLYLWIFSRNPIQASFRSFLIPFLGLLAIFSPLVQLAIRRLFALKDFHRYTKWSYIGSHTGYQHLQETLKWSRVQVCLEHVLPHEIDSASSYQYIVDHFYDQPAFLLETLYRYQQQGSVVLSRLSWCELVLQRFPPEFLDGGDLLDGRFSMPRGTFQSRLKRVGDVVVAAVLLILASPLILVSALCIKCNDSGPVFILRCVPDLVEILTGYGNFVRCAWMLNFKELSGHPDQTPVLLGWVRFLDVPVWMSYLNFGVS